MELANRIRQIRKAANLTQDVVAEKCNISPAAYGKMERRAGGCSYDTLQKIAKALHVEVLFLLDVKNPNYLPEKYNL